MKLAASCRLLSSCILVVSTACVYGQTTAAQPATSRSTFRAEVQTVVVDVVVTDHDGKFRRGLHKEDFELREQGQPQKITFFEEHDGLPAEPDVHRTPLPQGVFTNEPDAPVPDAVNVLLLDSLNTEIADQSYVHSQATKYLKNAKPGTRMAIFTLSTQLRFVLGFTTDASNLSAALNEQHGNGKVDKSWLLGSDVEQSQVSQLASLAGSDPAMGAALSAMAAFQAENTASQTNLRMALTFKALQDLARYLAAVPGRKNVIWFAGSFPVTASPDDKRFAHNEDLHNLTNALAAARISLYPIRAGGVPTDRLYDGTTRMTSGSAATPFQRDSLQRDSVERALYSAVAGQLADDTGGEAVYGTNDLAEAVDKMIDRGERYYTMTYTPTDKRTDGRYRQIKIKVPGGQDRLAYRRGYFADSPKTIRQAAQERATSDPLMPLMDPVLPDVRQILFKVQVMPSDPQPPFAPATATPAPAQETVATQAANTETPDTKPIDSTRYTADLAVFMSDVRLQLAPDGKRVGNLELMLVAFDRKGNALNWAVQRDQLALTPDTYQELKDSGIQLHHEIDVPRGAVNLRVGVFDTDSNKAGTLQIPLTSLPAATVKQGIVANF